MKTRAISVGALTEDDVARWTDLMDRAIEPYPFLDPRMLVASARHRSSAREMQIMFVEDGSTLIAVMPFRVRRTNDRVPLNVVTTRTGFFDEVSAYDHPLLDAAHAIDAIEAILLGLRAERVPGLVEFFGLPAGGDLEDALIAACERAGPPLVERERREFSYILRPDRSPTADAAEADPEIPEFGLMHTSSHTRRNYARLARRLSEQVGAELRSSDRSDDPDVIGQFIELQNSGWKGDPTRGGESLRLRGEEEWFREVTDRYRTDGDLIVHTLTAGNELIHVAVNLRVRHDVFALTDTFNERFAPFKAGTLGRISSINRVFRDPTVRSLSPDLVDRSHAANEFFPDHGDRLRILVANEGARSRAIVRGMPAAREFRARLRSLRPAPGEG